MTDTRARRTDEILDGDMRLALPNALLIETVVTTIGDDGVTNIAPMGPLVDPDFRSFLFRPFQTSTTYRNLERSRAGILHITDDVELIAQAAVGQPNPRPRLIPATKIAGNILADACRWYAFRVEAIDNRQPRTEILARVVDQGRFRDFLGFNRARHAVLEAAILATRIHLLPADTITAEFRRLQTPIEKTGGHVEHRAFRFLQDYVQTQLATSHPPASPDGPETEPPE